MPDEVLDVEVMPAATPLPPSLVVAPGSVVEAVEIAHGSPADISWFCSS